MNDVAAVRRSIVIGIDRQFGLQQAAEGGNTNAKIASLAVNRFGITEMQGKKVWDVIRPFEFLS